YINLSSCLHSVGQELGANAVVEQSLSQHLWFQRADGLYHISDEHHGEDEKRVQPRPPYTLDRNPQAYDQHEECSHPHASCYRAQPEPPALLREQLRLGLVGMQSCHIAFRFWQCLPPIEQTSAHGVTPRSRLDPS